MPRLLNDPDGDDLAQGRSGSGRRIRQMQRRANSRIRAAEAQEIAARAAEKNARYMLWATIIAVTSAVVSAATTIFAVFVALPHAAH